MELEALLAPIAGAAPCGEDMSFSPEFDQITEMRRQDDPSLDQGEWVTSLKVADWSGVSHICTTLLNTRTKDLRVAMWLTESLAITQGYAGLDRGLHLCSQLCERYWADLHPQADSGDFEERIGNIGWLLHRVVALANAMPFTKARNGAAYSLRDLAAAKQQTSQPEHGNEGATRHGRDAPTLDQLNRALKETPATQLLGHLQSARQCQAHLRAWQQVVDGHLGADGPGFVQAKEALASVIHELERLARDTGALSNGGALPANLNHAQVSQAEPMNNDGTNTSLGNSSPLRSRAQALQQLREVASFFRHTEPHSPVAYLAEKAVKWGEMPLHEWLRQVIKDQGAISHLEELLGLDNKPDPSA
jgi:type VI secretion system protein ImpA